MSKPVKHFYEFGRFRLDPTEQRLLRDGVPIPLAPKAFETLVVLIRNNRHLLTKDELMKAVWADAFVEENNLEKIISLLRKTLGKSDAAENYIETVRRRGYRFTASVHEIFTDEDLSAPEHTPESVAFETIETENDVESTGSIEIITDTHLDATTYQRDVTPRSPVVASNIRWLEALKARKAGAFIIAASLLLIVTTSFFYIKLRRIGGRSETHREMTFARLTNGGDVRNATISPDGKYFVYEEQDGGISHLWVRQTEQNNPLEIIPPAERSIYGTTFSLDGQFIYYLASEKHDPRIALYRVPTLGGVQTKLLTNITSPVTFSPDGKQIAFVRYDNGLGSDSHIVVASSDGGDERILLTRTGREYISGGGASWSPDGKLIAYGAVSGATKIGGPLCDIIGVDVQTGAAKSLTAQKWDSCGRIAWTSDGQGFVVIGTKQGESDSVRRDQVWYVTYPEGETSRLTTDLSRHYYESLGVTNDNSLIVVPFNRTSQIWSMEASGDARTAVQLTNGTSDGRGGVVALPDKRIVYIARTGDHVDLWQMNADGTNQKQLTNDSSFLEEVRATSDGRFLIFASKRDGRDHLFRIDKDGANLKQLTKGESYELDSDCSPDGQWIVYASRLISNDKFESETLWKIPIEGGAPVHLTERQAESPHFSPDGKLISYIYPDKVGEQKIGILSTDGGAPVKTFNPIKNPELNTGARFTPNGQALTYIVVQKNFCNIWLQPLNGGAAYPLTDFKSGEIYNYNFSNDGTRLFLARGYEIRDALLIKNFR